jgi:hypothetical protein
MRRRADIGVSAAAIVAALMLDPRPCAPAADRICTACASAPEGSTSAVGDAIAVVGAAG